MHLLCPIHLPSLLALVKCVRDVDCRVPVEHERWVGGCLSLQRIQHFTEDGSIHQPSPDARRPTNCARTRQHNNVRKAGTNKLSTKRTTSCVSSAQFSTDRRRGFKTIRIEYNVLTQSQLPSTMKTLLEQGTTATVDMSFRKTRIKARPHN